MSTAEEIYLLGKKLRLLQPEGGFRPGLDSVMLAAACPAAAGDSVLDLGCGVGSAGLCVLTRVPDTILTGIDIQDDHIDLAKQNAVLNAMEERCNLLPSSVTDFLASSSFDHVICNPPYMEDGNHIPSPSDKKAKARGQDETNLQDWLETGFHSLKAGGSFTIIHRADQTDKILQDFGKRFGAVEIIPLWPKQDTPAKRIIIRALKNRKSPAKIHPGIVLHQKNGDYTPEAEKILREAAPIL